jgi:predicted oxidoreductase
MAVLELVVISSLAILLSAIYLFFRPQQLATPRAVVDDRPTPPPTARMANSTDAEATEAPRVLLIGAGLASLVAAFELTQRGVRCLIIDQENRANLGGQAFWSLGAVFCVNSRAQRRMGIKDSHELAMQDWLGTAQFGSVPEEDRDVWPRQWAKAFVKFAEEEMEDYCAARGITIMFNVGWAERGDGNALGSGNSVPRFHLPWGVGPQVVKGFADPALEAEKKGLVEFRFRHCVDELLIDDRSGRVVGVKGRVLEDQPDLARGVASSRKSTGTFEHTGSAVLIATGGIGGNVELVKASWPVDRLGPKVPKDFVVGVPAHVDGRMLGIAESAGVSVINKKRMWHYTEGLANWEPIWPGHGIRVLPAPSSLWLDATGKRLPAFLFPGSDTMKTLKYICSTGYDYTWMILDQAIIAKEFALSGSEQNPDIANKSYIQVLMNRVLGRKGTPQVQDFMKYGKDFVVKDTLEDLVKGMNEIAASKNGPILKLEDVRAIIEARDSQFVNKYSKDAQAMLFRTAWQYWPDTWSRLAKPHRLLEGGHGPLIAVHLNLLTRKTLGGIETDLSSRVFNQDGELIPGLYAAGEVAGFGGGGVHGHAALEGTFIGGCIFSGRAAGRAMADEIKRMESEGVKVTAKGTNDSAAVSSVGSASGMAQKSWNHSSRL